MTENEDREELDISAALAVARNVERLPNPLLHGLNLTRLARTDHWIGKGMKTPWGRVFGGQTLAQCLMAACESLALDVRETTRVHSFHAYFLAAGTAKDVLFSVERLRDGRSFQTRLVRAFQNGKTLASAVSLERRSEREPTLIASTPGTNRSIVRTRPSLRSSSRALGRLDCLPTRLLLALGWAQ